MSEQDVREGLWAAVAGEPPLSFDPDALMAKAVRDLKRRRALVGVGVATTAVAVAAVAVPVVLGSPRGGDGGSTPRFGAGSPPSSSEVALPTASTPQVEWPPAGIEPVNYTAAQLAERGDEMQTYLRTHFAKVVPAAKNVSPQAFGGEQTGAVSDGQDYLNAFTTFTVNGAASAVDVYLSAPGGKGPQPCSDPQCQATQQKDGSWVIIEKHDDGPRAVVSVIHFRLSGSVVRATGYNYDPTGDTSKVLDTPPVTVEQLTALATDSKLSL